MSTVYCVCVCLHFVPLMKTDFLQAKLADFENQTIQKQRQELTSMIAELRDRDHELNDMVASHQKQLAAWEQDRQKMLLMEEKCAKLERMFVRILTFVII